MSSVLRYVYLKSSTEWEPLKFNATLRDQGEFMAGEIYRLSGSHGLVGGEHDRQARETVLQVGGQVELLANSAHEELLFAPAELIVTGLVSLRQPFVRAGKATGWCQLCIMHAIRSTETGGPVTKPSDRREDLLRPVRHWDRRL
jgi:hypothetical protein